MGVLIFNETGIKGSVPAGVKLVIDDDQNQAQRLVIVGLQSQHYDASANAALHYECEGRTALGGSAAAIGPAGASGAGSNVMRQTNLLATSQAIMSTQAAGGGAHLSHVGDFRVFMRLQVPASNTGTVSVQLEWGEGDFRVTTLNRAVAIPDGSRGSWVLVDLGTVNLSKVTQGTQRWEGRARAWSTVIGDDIDLDRVFLAPTGEGYGEVSAPYFYRHGVISARDEFTGLATNAALHGRVAPQGGTWATSGVANDFLGAAFDSSTGPTAHRNTGSEASPGRLAILPTSLTDAEVGVDFYSTPTDSAPVSGSPWHFVIGRYVDANNYLRAEVSARNGELRLVQRVAGSDTLLSVVSTPDPRSTWHTLQVIVYATGQCYARLRQGDRLIATVRGTSAALATGGALASGQVGFGDYNAGGGTARYYDNFYAATPAAEPLAIAPGRSLELRSDGVSRQNADGTLWVTPTYEGFYPTAPPAWNEGRTLRALVATCRGPELASRVWADAGVDDVSARLTYTPRFLTLPEA